MTNVQLETSFAAGRLYVLDGPDTANCNHDHFSTLERATAWELGKRDAAKEKIQALANKYGISILILQEQNNGQDKEKTE